MQQGRSHQPGHERGVFHRIPEPPAAPAQHVVSPGAAQQNAQRQKAPGRQRPRARPACPGSTQLARDQCRQRERKRHGKAHIAHVQQRRMQHHAGILQQGVEVLALRSRRDQACKRVGEKQQEQQQAHADPSQHREHARHEGRRQVSAAPGHRQGPAREHELPQQHGAFMTTPERCQLVGHGQVAMGIGRHIQHREVSAPEAPEQAGRRQHAQRA